MGHRGGNPLTHGPPASLNRAILAIALPAMLTNIATALIGLADIWVIGQLGAAEPQAGVEIGSKLFLFVVAICNFLGTATTSLTAQAGGRDDIDDQARVLARSAAIALAIGVAMLAAARLALPLAIAALGGTGSVAGYAHDYASVRAFAVPAALLNMALVGVLIGRKRLRQTLAIEIAYNLVHIGLALALVISAGFGVRGAAIASLAAEMIKLALVIFVLRSEAPMRRVRMALRDTATWAGPALLALFAINRDIFLRTLLLLLAILVFTRAGAAQGPTVLAANAILFQIFLFTGMIMNGFEAAAQVLGGEAAGRHDREGLVGLTWRLLAMMGGAALVLSLALAFGGADFARWFTRAPAVADTLGRYAGWTTILPLLCVPSFVFDGIFIGAIWTRAMLVSMAGAFALYGAALVLLLPFGNNGLWLAFCLLFVFRGGLQAALMPGLLRRQFG